MNIKNILHYPRLDTVLAVEKMICENSGEYTKTQIWDRLPKKIMYQTFSLIIDYIMEIGKIAVDKEGKICWIWNPELIRKYLKRKDLEWK
jgi:hypothetical protein